MSPRSNSCPCCDTPLLRHARQGGLYWFCTSCRQDMPILLTSKLPRLDSITVNPRAAQTLTS